MAMPLAARSTVSARPAAQAFGVRCEDCLYLRVRPGGTPWKRKSGCFHPELVEQSQSDRFLQEQIIPGDHEKLNRRGDCPKFTPGPRRLSLVQRVVQALRT